MTISELIKALEAIQDAHGDLYVERSDGHLIGAVEPIREQCDEDGEVIAARIS